MTRTRFRVFPPAEPIDDLDPPTDRAEPDDAPSAVEVEMRLSDLFPLLRAALHEDYLWIRDFQDDRIVVSRDLHEILATFAKLRPPA